MLAKKCPLCGKVYEYENMTVCPLLHCPSCGDAPVKRRRKNESKIVTEEITVGYIYGYYSLLTIALFFFLLFLYGISPVFFGAEITGTHQLFIRDIGIVGLIFFASTFIMISMFFIISNECARCRSSFIIPKRNIPLETLDLAVQVCKKCEAEMPKNAKFCGVCGYKLIEQNKEGKVGLG